MNLREYHRLIAVGILLLFGCMAALVHNTATSHDTSSAISCICGMVGGIFVLIGAWLLYDR